MSKPKPPKLNPNFSASDMPLPPDLFKMRQRFKFLQAECGKGKTKDSYIAFEAITFTYVGLSKGYTDEDLRKTWPPEWGEYSVTLPFGLMHILAELWTQYQEAPPGKSLGEVLGIEGGGRGKAKMRDRRKTIDANFMHAQAVCFKYLEASPNDEPISLEVAQEIVAEERNVSVGAVQLAYKQHGKWVMEELRLAGAFL